jgi:hypothetical protein
MNVSGQGCFWDADNFIHIIPHLHKQAAHILAGNYSRFVGQVLHILQDFAAQLFIRWAVPPVRQIRHYRIKISLYIPCISDQYQAA